MLDMLEYDECIGIGSCEAFVRRQNLMEDDDLLVWPSSNVYKG